PRRDSQGRSVTSGRATAGGPGRPHARPPCVRAQPERTPCPEVRRATGFPTAAAHRPSAGVGPAAPVRAVQSQINSVAGPAKSAGAALPDREGKRGRPGDQFSGPSPSDVTVARTSCWSRPASLHVEVGQEGVVLLLLGVGAVAEFLE